ncbi:MAG TPA: bifunctional riboflavin kinase/FAD synthetase [Acidimicrobiales bacterium]|nr:bifunctional riboflavin kinase/FAD synthetase [Acidimicrobiales bacterium]
MEVVRPDECAPPPGGSAVTIGAYDGIHVGHRALLAELRRLAAAQGLSTAVVTFDRHPATVVRPESAPRLLTDLPQKLELLAACGVDRTLVVPFDRARADESAEDFVHEVLVGNLGARLVVVGQDFHFGHGRKGNVELLAELGRELGFGVVGVGLHAAAGRPVSSTRVRELLAAGDVGGAADLLGRFHQVRGVVVTGDRRGGPVLGFPTANLAVPPEIALPAEGIYAATYTRPSGSVHQAAVSVGRRPSFHRDAPAPVVEAHLLDFDGDLYGEEGRLSFVARLREERRYDDVGALVAQMHDDVARTRAVLAARGAPTC